MLAKEVDMLMIWKGLWGGGPLVLNWCSVHKLSSLTKTNHPELKRAHTEILVMHRELQRLKMYFTLT